MKPSSDVFPEPHGRFAAPAELAGKVGDLVREGVDERPSERAAQLTVEQREPEQDFAVVELVVLLLDIEGPHFVDPFRPRALLCAARRRQVEIPGDTARVVAVRAKELGLERPRRHGSSAWFGCRLPGSAETEGCERRLVRLARLAQPSLRLEAPQRDLGLRPELSVRCDRALAGGPKSLLQPCHLALLKDFQGGHHSSLTRSPAAEKVRPRDRLRCGTERGRL